MNNLNNGKAHIRVYRVIYGEIGAEFYELTNNKDFHFYDLSHLHLHDVVGGEIRVVFEGEYWQRTFEFYQEPLAINFDRPSIPLPMSIFPPLSCLIAFFVALSFS